MFTTVLAMTLAASQTLPVANHWSGLRSHRCPECLSTKERRLASNNLQLPESGIVYFWAGEFAKDVQIWMIDLDSGSVSHCAQDDQRTCQYGWTMSGDALRQLRRSALKRWVRDTSCTIEKRRRMAVCHAPSEYMNIAPGTMDDSYVVGANRMVPFSPLDRRDKVLSEEVQRAIEKVHSPH